jgi:hypothetical protein
MFAQRTEDRALRMRPYDGTARTEEQIADELVDGYFGHMADTQRKDQHPFDRVQDRIMR